MEDLIKRSDALNEIASYMAYTFKDCGASSPRYSAMYEEAKVFQRIILGLPTIQGDYGKGFCDGVQSITDGMVKQGLHIEKNREQGEWIKDGHHIRCKNCGVCICDKDREGDTYPQNFCPNCGCRMKGASNGEDIQSADE